MESQFENAAKDLRGDKYTKTKVRSILYNIIEIRESQYKGYFERATPIIIDIENAINTVLTERQRQIVELMFYKLYNQEQTAEILGLSQQAIQKALRISYDKMARFLNGDIISKEELASKPKNYKRKAG